MNHSMPRPPCPSPTPGVYSNSCPSSRWCHPAISSSVVPFSSCPQSLPASGSFLMSQLLTWGGQSIGLGVLPSHKKEWNNAIFSNMERPRDYRTKWSKSERNRQIPYDILNVESKIWHKWGFPGGASGKEPASRCRRQKRSKAGYSPQGTVLQHRELYSISCNKPEWKRIWKMICIYVYINEWLCCTPETNNIKNQLFFNKKIKIKPF